MFVHSIFDSNRQKGLFVRYRRKNKTSNDFGLQRFDKTADLAKRRGEKSQYGITNHYLCPGHLFSWLLCAQSVGGSSFWSSKNSIGVDGFALVLKCSPGKLRQSRFMLKKKLEFQSWLHFQIFLFSSKTWQFMTPFLSSPNNRNFQAVRGTMIRLWSGSSFWPNSCGTFHVSLMTVFAMTFIALVLFFNKKWTLNHVKSFPGAESFNCTWKRTLRILAHCGFMACTGSDTKTICKQKN